MGQKPGDRVFAVQSANREQVFLLGKGVYEGDFAPPGDEWPEGYKNPRIKLDDGGTVWGYQCWWGAEDRFDNWAQGREVVPVKVSEQEESNNA